MNRRRTGKATPKTDPWAEGIAHLRAVDERWHPLIDRVGPCPLRPLKDRFGSLVRAIVAQQISAKAARSINLRLIELIGSPLDPEHILAAGSEKLRPLGLSQQKANYVLGLAEAVASGQLRLQHAGRWSDEVVIERLTEIKGIGRWTAEMFLIFALNRPDVLPIHDFGIRAGLRNYFGLPEMPKPSECVPLAEPWRPHRTVAMWYLWRSLDTPKPPS